MWEEPGGPEKAHSGTGRTWTRPHAQVWPLVKSRAIYLLFKWQFLSECADISTRRPQNEIKGWALQLGSAVSRNHRGQKPGDQPKVSITERQFKVKRWFRWRDVSESPLMVNEASEAHQHLMAWVSGWENVTAAFLKCFFQSLPTELSAKCYILKGHLVM